MERNTKDSKKKKDRKAIDGIALLILIIIVTIMLVFTMTRQTSNQEIILMEIYKCAGPNTSTDSMEHYYIYQNTNTIKIRNANPDGSNSTISKDIKQESIDSLQKSLDEYIGQNPIINSNFYINERYTIEYNGNSIIVPNPSIVTTFDCNPNDYTFYNKIESFMNNINN